MWPGTPVIDSNAQKTSVFHPLDPILSNSHRIWRPDVWSSRQYIASRFAEWGVKEFSRHQLCSSDKALFKDVTVLSTVSPMQSTVASSTYIKTEPEVTALGRSLVYKANNVVPSTDPWGIPQETFSTVEQDLSLPQLVSVSRRRLNFS